MSCKIKFEFFRVLKRENEDIREITQKLCSLHIIDQKLLPLFIDCSDDMLLVMTLLKLFVMLTLPMTTSTRKRAVTQIKKSMEKEKRVDAVEVRVECREQYKALVDVKGEFCRGDFFGILVGLLEEPLSKREEDRSREEEQLIELALTLFRNLLVIEVPEQVDVALSRRGREIHLRLVGIFGEEMVLEIVSLVGGEVNKGTTSSSASWNLVILEIIDSLLRYQDVKMINVIEEEEEEGEEESSSKNKENSPNSITSSISAFLAAETKKRVVMGGGRGNRFRGGALRRGVLGGEGKSRVIPSSTFQQSNPNHLHNLPLQKRRADRRNKPFKGNNTPSNLSLSTVSLLESRARVVVGEFIVSFLDSGFEGLVTSLKNEFRRDSSRIQPGDDLAYFRVVSFFIGAEIKKGGGKWDVRRIVQALDLFSFRFVINHLEVCFYFILNIILTFFSF